MAIVLRLLHGLPIVCIDVVFSGRRLRLENVLLDTGSSGTILDADKVAEIGVKPEGTDRTAIIHGVGGTEIVFTKWFDAVALGDWTVKECKVEIGAMDYGIEIDGILGFDFIRTAGLIIDTNKMQVYASLHF
ncbi:retropepsin-like aspartic protease [Paenibacillus hexagrammi]|uniref:Retropepsin-like domain-containing protein n=1 Tax=Paenibacillus hexagrammi TaxID=2908839 RepID=A0ABY3SH03_9BACL|nr:retropepsin-like aspartic protease [Paenibacillus sp. YPD9-1]UJF33019.1 retropepsin-like domain-containing protein [Paenibacillus sp. YPD9-1]